MTDPGPAPGFSNTFADAHTARESKLSSYAGYLVKHNRWEERARDAGLNSHSLMLAVYKRMLGAWRPLWKEKTSSHGRFSLPELQTIADERVQPSNR